MERLCAHSGCVRVVSKGSFPELTVVLDASLRDPRWKTAWNQINNGLRTWFGDQGIEGPHVWANLAPAGGLKDLIDVLDMLGWPAPVEEADREPKTG